MTGWDPKGNESGLPPFIPEAKTPPVMPQQSVGTYQQVQQVWPYPTVDFEVGGELCALTEALFRDLDALEAVAGTLISDGR